MVKSPLQTNLTTHKITHQKSFKLYSFFKVSTLCNLHVMSSSPPHFSSLPSPSSSNSTVPYFILRASTTSAPSFPTRRPWEEVFALYSFTRPFSLNEAWERVRRNFTHFRVNYTMIDLFILFLSLLWHPISVIVFLVVLVAWCFLYFFRDAPVEAFHRTVDERVVVVSLSALTVVGLSLTGVSFNVSVAAMVGVAVCVVHAAFRSTEDLYAEENEGYDGGLRSVVGGSPTKRIKGYNLIM